MNLVDLEFYAQSLGGATRVKVLLPAASPETLAQQGPQAVYAQQRRWPVLLLLHGMQGSETAWLRHSLVEQYAAEAGLAVVMPTLLNSFGFDLSFNLSFEQLLRVELPAFLASHLPLDFSPASYTVAGLSMGGFAALRLAMLDPDRYAAAGSFSGAVDPARIADKHGQQAAGAVLAPEHPLEQLEAVPPLYLACGEQDPLVLEMNRKLHAQLLEKQRPHTYEEWPGGHDWSFWDAALRRFLLWRADLLAAENQIP